MKKLSVGLLASLLIISSTTVSAKTNNKHQNVKTETASSTTDASFNQKFTLHGISFQVTSKGNKLRIVPSGLKIDNTPIERDIEGTVTGADIGDINVDRSPEIYIYIKDSKGNASLILKKSVGPSKTPFALSLSRVNGVLEATYWVSVP